MEGPREIFIPEIRIKTCSGCMHYMMKIIRTGLAPEYEHHCKLPEAPRAPMHWEGNLGTEMETGQKYAVPGDWCPYNTELEF